MTDPKPELFVRETEFFGFTPISFVDDVINSVNEYLYQAMEQLQTFFTEQDKTGKTNPKEEIQRVTVPHSIVFLRLPSDTSRPSQIGP